MEYKATIRPAKEHPKNYKECEQIHLGITDIGSILFRPCAGTPVDEPCGYDGSHKAYLMPWDEVAIPLPEYYEEVLHCENWLKIYDDNALTAEIFGNMITVYRAGGTFVIRITHQ